MSNITVSRRYTQLNNGNFLAVVYRPDGQSYTIDGFNKRYEAYQVGKATTLAEHYLAEDRKVNS